MDIAEYANNVACSLEYNTDIFKQKNCRKNIINIYNDALRYGLEKPEQKIFTANISKDINTSMVMSKPLPK